MNVLRFCGIVAGPLFVTTFLITGAIRDGYDPMRHAVSSLALGPSGWTQTANFLITGVLTVAFAAGLMRGSGTRQRIGAALVGVWGIGLLGAGAFVGDPTSGYPPGTPPLPDPPTTLGVLHDAFSVPAFFALASACFVLAGGRGARWLVYSVLSGLVVLVAFMVSGLGFSQHEAFVDLAGLAQRISVITGFTWLTALAVRQPSRDA